MHGLLADLLWSLYFIVQIFYAFIQVDSVISKNQKLQIIATLNTM